MEVPPKKGTLFRLEVYKRIYGFHELKYRKGLERRLAIKS